MYRVESKRFSGRISMNSSHKRRASPGAITLNNPKPARHVGRNITVLPNRPFYLVNGGASFVSRCLILSPEARLLQRFNGAIAL